MTYKQLTYESRCQIYTLQSTGMSPKEIAKHVKVDRSTIYRELKRNTGGKGYRFKQANETAKERRNKASNKPTKMTPALIERIEECLRKYWSPEQISGFFKASLNTEISYESIYLHIWANKKKGGTLYRCLRRKGKKYNIRAKKNAGRGCIPDRIDISKRPKIVEKKSRLGDWEGDTIIGANQEGVILTLVDRKSKFTLIAPMNGKHAEQVPGLILKAFKGLPRKIDLHTITFDNGKEFSKHKKITLKTGVICYFATPYHSWERGLNENTNGLIRQYFPKKSNLKKFTPEDIRFVENQLNNRPRKTLGYRTPREVFLGIKYLPKILKKTRAVKHTSLVLSSENIERKGILGKRSPKYLHPPCLLSFQLKSIL